MKREKLENKIKRLIAGAVSVVSVFVIFGGQTSFAQVVRKKPPVEKVKNIRVFKSGGKAREDNELAKVKGFSTPVEISATNLSTIFGDVLKANGVAIRANASLAVETYAVLTSRNPFQANKAVIDFFKPLKVDAGQNIAAFEPGKVGFDINILPDRADRWFMLTCIINTGPNSTFQILGPDGSSVETILNGSGYLHAYLLVQNKEWQKLKIRRIDDGYWGLGSCSVTTAEIP